MVICTKDYRERCKELEVFMKLQQSIIGAALLISSAVLLAAKYISAAVFSANAEAWGKEEFTQVLQYTPTLLNVVIYSTLVLGVVFIVVSLLEKKTENL